MGGHACDLSDHTKMPELVTTILRMHEGLSKNEAIKKIQDPYARRVVELALCDHEEIVEQYVSDNTAPIDIF